MCHAPVNKQAIDSCQFYSCQQASKQWTADKKESVDICQIDKLTAVKKKAIENGLQTSNWQSIGLCQEAGNWQYICQQGSNLQLSTSKQLITFWLSAVNKQSIDSFQIDSCQQARQCGIMKKTNIAPFKVFTCLGCCKVKKRRMLQNKTTSLWTRLKKGLVELFSAPY